MASILGINLTDLNKKQLLQKINFLLNDNKSHFLVTPNPEIILNAAKDEEYFFILNAADLAIADGFGLILAGVVQGKKMTRLTGSDLTPYLLNLAQAENKKTLIINWRKGLSTESDIYQALNNKYPKLNCKIIDIDKKEFLNETEKQQIKNFAPQLIFVTLGAPYQEKLIYHELKEWSSVNLALAVGGSFDFLTNKIKRAPRLFRQIGLEWLWRLIKQPQRLKRIWRATVVFTLKVLNSLLIQPLIYRRNVAIMLYKKTENSTKILLVCRQDNPEHWQLPQGGTDGESLLIAGSRELREELGTDKFKPLKTFKNLHVYEFTKSGLTPGKTGYRGQKQGLLIAEFLGDDDDIKINYWDHCNWKWIEADMFTKSTHPVRQEGYQKFYKAFLETVK